MALVKRCSNPQHWDEPQDACLMCQAALKRYRVVTAGPHDAFQYMEAHETGCWLNAADVEAVLKWALPIVIAQHQPLNHVRISEERTCVQCQEHYKAKAFLDALRGGE